MRLIQFIVCISVLLTKPCWAGLINKTSEIDQERLVETTIDILDSCYADRSNTVGLAGPSAGRILTRMSLRETVIPATLIDETSRIGNHSPVDRGSRYKLQVFAITTTNQIALLETLEELSWSKWWNHMASFLLIDLSEVEDGCANAVEILRQSWSADLLNSKFVCLHRKRGLLIYTFNPYTDKAPLPWQQKATYEEVNGHIWTLFAREYREDGSRCDRLDFAKTTDLGGYEIRASVKGMENWWSADPNVEPRFFHQVQNITAQILMSSPNVTWKLLVEPANESEIVDPETGETYNFAAAVMVGINDICLNFVMQRDDFGRYETTYALFEDDLAILTHYPGHKSQLDKIVSVLDRSSRFGVFVVFVVTLLFFKFWLGRSLIAAILDLVLLICNAGLHRLPRNTAPRIYLASLFIFVVTIQGIYSSQFASMLTKEVRLPTVNTIEDLARSDHIIYGQEEYRFIFNQSAFEGRYFEPSTFDDVLKDPRAALVDVSSVLTDIAAAYNLHLSRKTIGHLYGVYLIRPDWPLEEKFNEVIGQVAASDIVKQLYRSRRDRLRRAIESYETQDQEPEVKVLTLENLVFAFVILGIGLVLSTITFVIEVAFYDAVTEHPRRRIRR